MKRSFLRRWMRECSSTLLAAVLCLLVWVVPTFDPCENMNPRSIMHFMVGIFLLFLVYLLIQGIPFVGRSVGTGMAHTTDMIFSGVPGVAAFVCILFGLFGVVPLSAFWMELCPVVMAVVALDLWIFGGIGAKILHLTDDVHLQKMD